MPAARALELAGVGKSYGNAPPVLADVDLSVFAGEAVALLGRSGSGKTTLLHLMAGVLAPDAGQVRVNGQPMPPGDEDARARLRRQHVGYIFQHFNLLPTLNVIENLEFPLALAGQRAERRQLLDELATLGLAPLAQRFPGSLSGGEQQRLAVLRALIHRPAVVLADEPTAALDLDNARQVIELLLAQCRRRSAALVLVTHSSDLSVAMDRVLRIEGRTLVAVR